MAVFLITIIQQLMNSLASIVYSSIAFPFSQVTQASNKIIILIPSPASPRMQQNQSRISQSGNPHKLTRIIELSPNSKMQDNIRDRVKQKLTEDAQFLLEKKKREEDKKERVRKMEDNLERERDRKLKLLSEKEAKSEVVREMNREMQNKKFKQKSDQFKKIIDKIGHQNEQQIEKALSLQKQLQTSHPSKNFSKTSKDPSFQSNPHSRTRFQLDNIDDKISSIAGKAAKAQQQHQEQKRMLVERIREKARSIDQVQKRAHSYSLLEEAEVLRSYYEKEAELQRVADHSRTQNEKRLLEKRKSVKEKLDKCSENLKYLTNKQQEKYQELQIKFNKKSEPKQWKDVRLEKYKQKWEQNARRIEMEKEEKAEQILQKHQQISQQHKVYKEQKDKLIQAVKHSG